MQLMEATGNLVKLPAAASLAHMQQPEVSNHLLLYKHCAA